MPGKPPLLNAILRWVLTALIIANIASEMVYTLLPVYLSKLGATPVQIGLVFTGGGVFIALLQFVGGWISDRLGRLRAIAIGSLIASLGYLGFWLAPSWPWILPSLCLEFVSSALVGPSFSALIAEQSAPENRGKTFGIMRSALMVVTIVGPLAGGFLSNLSGFKTMLGLAFFLYFSAAITRIWIARRYPPLPAPAEAAPAPAAFFANFRIMFGLLIGGGILTWILITDGGRDIAFNLSSELLPVYLTTWVGLSVMQVGMFRALRGGASIIASLGAGWLTDHLGESFTLICGFLLQAAGLCLVVLLTGLAGLITAGVIFGAGIGMLFPAFDTLISKSVPDKMRGMAYGLFDSSRSLLAMPGPWVGGELWERISPRAPFLLTALLNLLCIIPAAFKLRVHQSENDPVPASAFSEE
jgi:MFS transporter, DHA1 family, multidrug resistance protein